MNSDTVQTSQVWIHAIKEPVVREVDVKTGDDGL